MVRKYLTAIAFGEKEGKLYVIVPPPPRGTVERWVELPRSEDWLQIAQEKQRLSRELKEANREREAVTQTASELSKKLLAQYERVAQLEQAIKRVTRRPEPQVEVGLICSALRTAFAEQGYHARSDHDDAPWWTCRRWFGCSQCVPDFLLLQPAILTNSGIELRRRIFGAVHRWVCELLEPALKESKE